MSSLRYVSTGDQKAWVHGNYIVEKAMQVTSTDAKSLHIKGSTTFNELKNQIANSKIETSISTKTEYVKVKRCKGLYVNISKEF